MYQIGTSGFSFADWVGPVYPPKTAQTKMLECYEQLLGFTTVELNFTYYRMPVPSTMESLLRRTADDFEFVVRTNKDMTHDIWADEKRTTLKDTTESFKEFYNGIKPLVDANRLGCVLIQLPAFFWPIPNNFRYLRRMPELLPDVPLVVEFRNRSWIRDTAFKMLDETGMGYCVVDEPKLPRLMPFDPRRTSELAYFRLHGRNENWFKASKAERYNYLYSKAELTEFVKPIQDTGKDAGKTFIFFNNCHAGAAARNALVMKEMLGLVDSLTPHQQQIVAGKVVTDE